MNSRALCDHIPYLKPVVGSTAWTKPTCHVSYKRGITSGDTELMGPKRGGEDGERMQYLGLGQNEPTAIDADSDSAGLPSRGSIQPGPSIWLIREGNRRNMRRWGQSRWFHQEQVTDLRPSDLAGSASVPVRICLDVASL